MAPPLALVAAGALFILGFGGQVVARGILRRLLSFNVMGSGVFLFLLASAPASGEPTVDPIAQALVLTGIVVAVASTALALLLARRLATMTDDAPTLESLDDRLEG